jgi:hypothetical protein
VEVFAWGPATFASGLASGDAAQRGPVRVYSPARTIADLMRMRHEVGESMAHIALGRYLAGRGSRVAELIQYGQVLGVLGSVRSAVLAAS